MRRMRPHANEVINPVSDLTVGPRKVVLPNPRDAGPSIARSYRRYTTFPFSGGRTSSASRRCSLDRHTLGVRVAICAV